MVKKVAALADLCAAGTSAQGPGITVCRLQIKNSEVETGSNKNRIHHVLSTSEVLEDGKETCLSASCGLARAICYF